MLPRTPAKPSIDDVSSTRILCAIRSLTATSAPITAEALVLDVRRKLGYGHTGPRIRAAIAAQLKVAEHRHLISRSGESVSVDYITIKEYSLAELQECVMSVVTRQPLERHEVIVSATRELGFSRTTEQIEVQFKRAINGLIRRNVLEGDIAHVWRSGRRRGSTTRTR